MIAQRDVPDIETWDLFCRVVDNYGDVGIAWRLARQLVDGDHRALRLFVDGLAVLARIEPRIASHASRQIVAGIEVRAWPSLEDDVEAADVAVELLGCGLPSGYLDAMEARPARGAAPTAWIDYEHLSAEAWVDDFHALPSPHPARPLVKHFFYPGFGERSGGLPIEPGLDARRRSFADDPGAVASFRDRLGIPATRRCVSLFAYPDAPVDALFDALASDAVDAWSVVVPEGVLAEPIAAWFHARAVGSARTRTQGGLAVTTIPFVDQDDYDRLLWSCDFNCVRGEDSFVRAQVAARPFVWAVYRQPDDVHLAKLAAFEDLHEAGLSTTARAAQRRWSLAWNHAQPDGQRGAVDAARAWLACERELRAHAGQWAASLSSAPLLAERLVAFAATRRSSP